VRKLGLLCGIVSPILWVGLIVGADLYRPDINTLTDFISELGERGSSTESVLRFGGFLFTGFLYLCLAAALPVGPVLSDRPGARWRAASVALFIALDGIGRMGAGVYPCDPGCEGVSRDQELHHLFATIGFCSGSLAALAAGFLYRSRFSLAMGGLTTVCLLLMTWTANPIHAEGLFERLATGALSVWLLVFAAGAMNDVGRIALLRRPNG
jgi:hypothetical membrane protein